MGRMGDVQYVGYRHADDGLLYEHEFGKGAQLETLEDGTLSIQNVGGGGRELHRDFSGQTFLVNPPRRKKMARRLPPRHKSGPKKGQFMSRRSRAASGRKRKRNPPARTRSRAPKRRAAARPRARVRRRRRNPPRLSVKGITKSLTEGAQDAVLVLTGKAAVRTIPTLARLPQGGNMGLAVQALTAVGVSILAKGMVSPARAKMILAGGLSAPIETLIISYQVPFLAPALQGVTGDAQISAYLGGYVDPPPILDAGVGGYVTPSALGQYGDPNEGVSWS